MSSTTKIEWADATWNPVTGCTLVSEGCRNCYAATLAATRLKHHPSRAGLARVNAQGVAKFTGEMRFNAQWLDQPLRWRRPRRIFVCAHGDLFHEDVPDEWIDKVFAVMALSAQHRFIVLTKRPERVRDYFSQDEGFGRWGYIEHQARKLADVPPGLTLAKFGGRNLPNVWLGVSVEDQVRADERIPLLLDTPAAVRFISAEPLLGPVDLCNLVRSCRVGVHEYDALECDVPPEDDEWNGATLDWVIVGGESGPDARPMHPDWARSLRDQCAQAGVPFFFKQWGRYRPVYDRDRDDPDWRRCGSVDATTPKGRWLNLDGGHGFHGERVVRIDAVGKRASGHLLDGVEHFNWPVDPAGVPA